MLHLLHPKGQSFLLPLLDRRDHHCRIVVVVVAAAAENALLAKIFDDDVAKTTQHWNHPHHGRFQATTNHYCWLATAYGNRKEERDITVSSLFLCDKINETCTKSHNTNDHTTNSHLLEDKLYGLLRCQGFNRIMII